MESWNSACVVCGGVLSPETIEAKEMMFGTKEEFTYRQCKSCGSLQIEQLLPDMGKYYPKGYYSFESSNNMASRVGRYAYKLGSALGKVPPVHRAAAWLVGLMFMRTDERRHMKILSPPLNARVLDVGSGSGGYLRTLRALGFRDLTGIDPFLDKPVYEPGLRLLKKDIYGMDGQFDIVIFDHSLEHVAWPRKILDRAASLLTPGGALIIRTPVVPSELWSKYRENWVQLDAPRHLFIPSLEGLEKMASGFGLEVFKVVYDMNESQLWSSEQYVKGIPLMSPRSYANDPKGGVFTRGQIREYRRIAKRLNREGKGDQVTVFLKKRLKT